MKNNSYKSHIEGMVDELVNKIDCKWFTVEDAKSISIIDRLIPLFETSFRNNRYWRFSEDSLDSNKDLIMNRLCKTVCHLQFSTLNNLKSKR